MIGAGHFAYRVHIPELAKRPEVVLDSVCRRGEEDLALIRDEFGLAAEFLEQGSAVSMISASKFCDAVALLLGCNGEQSDATSAYTHSKLCIGMKDPYIVIWVEVLRSQRGPEWIKAGITRPVCQLRLPLYGHPMPGTYFKTTSRTSS